MRFNLNKRVTFFQVPPYKRRWLATLYTLGILLLILVIAFYIIDFRVRPTLSQLANAKARQLTIQVINQAIRDTILPQIQYQNLIRLELNKDGKVAFLQPNNAEINRIAVAATLAVQASLKDLPPVTVRVPVGQVFGSQILAGYGPNLPVKVVPFGLVASEINDLFDQAGINQTRHRIFLRVKAVVKLIVPLISEELQINTDIPLTEAVIVGEVPNVYVGNGGIILPTGSK